MGGVLTLTYANEDYDSALLKYNVICAISSSIVLSGLKLLWHMLMKIGKSSAQIQRSQQCSLRVGLSVFSGLKPQGVEA